jgi:hypothetical protein
MKRLIVSLAVAAGLAASVGLVGATSATPVTVSLVSCVFGGGGNATVPAGSQVTVRIGWADINRGLVQDFLNAQTTTATVNGSPVANASSYWGPISDNNVTFWLYDTGVVLGAGDTMTVTADVSLSHPIPGGKDDEGHPLFNGPGSIFGGPITCTITGV